jgi:hypothetical protein
LSIFIYNDINFIEQFVYYKSFGTIKQIIRLLLTFIFLRYIFQKNPFFHLSKETRQLVGQEFLFKLDVSSGVSYLSGSSYHFNKLTNDVDVITKFKEVHTTQVFNHRSI